MQKLFTITASGAIQPVGVLSGVSKEDELQKIASANLEALFDIRFFDNEYRIKDRNNDLRIDTVGISKDNCPVLIEYKRGKNDNVVSQILAYRNVFLEKQDDFRWKVSRSKLGDYVADNLNFSRMRLICLAGDFSKYDEISWTPESNVELVTYRYFDNNTLLLEWKKGSPPALSPRPNAVRNPRGEPTAERKPSIPQNARPKPTTGRKSIADILPTLDSDTLALYEGLSQGITSFGNDIEVKTNRLTRFKHRKIFACLRPIPSTKQVHVWVSLDPKKEKIISGFTRDMSDIKRDAGGCELEIRVGGQQELQKALELCSKAYLKQKSSSPPPPRQRRV